MNTYSENIKIIVADINAVKADVKCTIQGHNGSGKILAMRYDTAFDYAVAHGLKSIAFPCVLHKMDKYEAARIALHSIFAHFRDGYDGVAIVCCPTADEEKYYRHVFWDESLSLLGHRDVVNKFKDTIDNIPLAFWKRHFGYIPDLEKGINDYFERDLGFPCDYPMWTHFFRFEIRDYQEIDNIYCLCCLATYMSRFCRWTDNFAPANRLCAILKALQTLVNRYYPYIFEFGVIAELHKRGYQLLRICPTLAPSGLAWRCIATTKKHTQKRCGALTEESKWSPLIVNVSHGKLFQSSTDEMTIAQAADKFETEYPKLVSAAKGHDPEYVRWFRRAYNLCRTGQIFFAVSDYGDCLKDNKMLGTKEFLPFPPAGESESLWLP